MSSWERPSHQALPYGKRASPYGIRPPGTGSYLGAQRLKVPVPFIPPFPTKHTQNQLSATLHMLIYGGITFRIGRVLLGVGNLAYLVFFGTPFDEFIIEALKCDARLTGIKLSLYYVLGFNRLPWY